MKNSIFKSYTKKILRSEAFVSVIIVFVLALGIIGTSYALYMDVDTDTDYQLVEVGDLSIGFDNGENIIELTNMTPTDDEIAITQTDNIFSFYIYNKGTYTVDYDIKLIPDDENGNAITANYINYQICKDNKDNCTDIKTLGEDNDGTIKINNPIYKDSLSPKKSSEETNPSAYYFLRIWINNTYTDTNGATIKYKVEVSAKNASGYLDNDNTLAGKILNNSNIKINNTVPSFTGIADYVITGDSTSGELGLFKAQDDYGTSYYFRGAQSYNYVNFAGFTWRIVRINGDGSIRLILDGSLDLIKHEEESDYVYKNATLSAIDSDGLIVFKTSPYNDNAYVGYMFGEFTGNSTSYDVAHQNKNSSTIKTYVDAFYKEYLLAYQDDYIADTLFCGDKTLASASIGSSNKATGFGTGTANKTYYAVSERLYFGTGTTSITTATPTLECASSKNAKDTLTENQRVYSRYTSIIDTSTTTSKGVLVNNDLTYPIGLLSADELVMAGAWGGSGTKTNQGYYLYDAYGYEIPTSYDYWLTMSPYYFSGSNALGFRSTSTSGSLFYNSVSNANGVRPVINLKADVLVESGDGTRDTTVGNGPYTIKLN